MASNQLDTVIQYVYKLAGASACVDLADAELLRRFTAHADEGAFTALLQRHTPLVLGVCRRTLNNPQDAEDAFQATFLVLARKAGSVRGSLVGWLHRVAYHAALRVRATAARRHRSEKEAATMASGKHHPDVGAGELRAVLDEELQGLPEKYRLPLILCYLEDKSHSEAARQLGWPVGTVKGRLARGRDLLHIRLTRRGLAFSSGAMVAATATETTAASAQLLAETAKAASLFATGKAVKTGLVAARVIAIAEGMLKATMAAKLKVVAVVAIALAVAGTGAGVIARQGEGEAVQAAAGQPSAGAKPGEKVGDGAKSQQTPVRLDRYGDPLPEGAVARLGTVRFRNADVADSLAFTPDGTRLVSGGWGGVRVWDAATGKEIRRIGGELPNPSGPADLSPDGTLVAVGGWGKEEEGAAVYEVATGKRLYQCGKPSQSIMARFSPDGKILAVCEGNPVIHLHDARTGATLRSLEIYKLKAGMFTPGTVAAKVVFTPDSKVMISGGGDGAICFWDLGTGKELRRITAHPEGVNKIALSPVGSVLGSIGWTKMVDGFGQTCFSHGNRVHLWDVASGKKVGQLVLPTAEWQGGLPTGPNFMAFTSDGKALLTGGLDGVLRVWDHAAGKELRRFADHGGFLTACAVSPDGKTFAVADVGRAVRVRELATGRDLVQFGGHRSSVCAVAVSTSGTTVATAGEDRAVCLWDPGSGRELRRLSGHSSHMQGLAFAPDGRTLFASAYDKPVRAWDLATGEAVRQLEGRTAAGKLLALSRDGKILAASGPKKAIVVLDTATGQEVRTLAEANEGVAGAAFSPDGRTLIAWGHDKRLHRWDVASGKHMSLPCTGLGGGTSVVGFSPDGRLAALGGTKLFIAVVDLSTGQELRRFTGLPEGQAMSGHGIRCLAFSADGRTLAWGAPWDSSIRLGEVGTCLERRRLAGHSGRICSLAFSTDGKTVVSGAEDTTALVWDLIGKPSPPLSQTDLESYWEDLKSTDAVRAYAAIRRLVAEPTRSVPYLGRKLEPAAALDKRRVARLLAEIDSDQFAVREKAAQELAELGEDVLPDLRRVREGKPSLEVRRRIDRLIEGAKHPSGRRLQALRALEALEAVANPEASQILKRLAQGDPGARLTQEAKESLGRLSE